MSKIRVNPLTLAETSRKLEASSASTQELLAQMLNLAGSLDLTTVGDPATTADLERFATHMKMQVQIAVDVFTALGKSSKNAALKYSHGDKRVANRLGATPASNIVKA